MLIEALRTNVWFAVEPVPALQLDPAFNTRRTDHVNSVRTVCQNQGIVTIEVND